MSEPYPPAPEELASAEAVDKVMDFFITQGISLKLAHMSDEDKRKVLGNAEIKALLNTHRVDIIRTHLSMELVAEAKEIRRRWTSLFDHRTPENSRRYADLLFTARAILPVAVPWERIGYEIHGQIVPWTHQLIRDANGDPVVNMTIDIAAAKDLMAAHKAQE